MPDRPAPSREKALLAVAVPFALHLAAIALLADWTVDDAGISFAYAKNLATGHGLVSQPGRAPVEGFSNLAWVLVLAPLARAGADLVVASKVLGALAVLATMAVVQRVLARATGSLAAGVVASLLLAASPPLVVWTTSGLENGLTLLLAALVWAALAARPRGFARAGGLLAGVWAATRPEGLAAIAIGPLALSREGERRRAITDWLAGAALVVVPMFAVRLAWLHLLWPFPWYAKRVSPTIAARLLAVLTSPAEAAHRAIELLRALAGPLGPWLLGAALVVAVARARRREASRALAVALVMLAVTVAAYLALDDDWMGEARFGTAPALALFVVLALAAVPPRGASWRGPTAIAAVALISASGAPRLLAFALAPTTPLADVERQFARPLAAYRDALGLARASVLLPDVGALLASSTLEVHDAAGLTEPDVIHTLKADTPVWRWHHPEYFDWVFERVKPTFIVAHDFWSAVGDYDADPRFARDYAPIDAYLDPWTERAYGRRARAGAWVRRDALRAESDLDVLRQVRVAPFREPLAWRVAALFTPVPTDDAGLRAAAREAHAANAPHREAMLWQRVVAARADDVGALESLARALDAGWRWGEARDAWTRVEEAARKARDVARARAARERLAGTDPDTEMARLMEVGVQLLHARHDPTAAIAVFSRVLSMRGDHYGATYQLARALSDAHRTAEARAAWRRVEALAGAIDDRPVLDEARRHVAE